MPLTTVILTHGDPDGMVCAILLLRLHPEAILHFDNDRTLARRLGGIAQTEPVPDAVFITDIALGPDQHEPVQEALQELVARGTAVHLLDHHRGWSSHPEVLRLFATSCVTDNDGGTAAALVKRERLPHDTEAGFWLSVPSRRERSPQTTTHFALLTALQNRENYGRNKAILRALARDRTILPEWEALVQEHQQRQTDALVAALSAAETLITAGGLRIGWLDRRGRSDHIFIGDAAMAAHGWDVVATVMARKIMLGGAHINQGVSLGFLHGTHELDGVRLQVAGHDTPVAITPLDRGGDFVAAARKLIVESL